MALGDLPSVKQQFPDEAHEALRLYVDQTTVGVDDLAIAMQALAQLASTFFAALDSSVADRKQLNDRVAAVEARKVNLATATVSLGLLSIGSRDVTLSWDNSLGSANYQVDLLPSAALLGGTTFTVKTTYATSAIVTVRTTTLIAAGGSLAAVAWRYA